MNNITISTFELFKMFPDQHTDPCDRTRRNTMTPLIWFGALMLSLGLWYGLIQAVLWVFEHL